LETAHQFGIHTARWQAQVSCDGTRVYAASGFFTAESAFRHASIYLSSLRFNTVSRFMVEVSKEEAANEGAEETKQP